jgi:hypothetical protein
LRTPGTASSMRFSMQAFGFRRGDKRAGGAITARPAQPGI